MRCCENKTQQTSANWCFEIKCTILWNMCYDWNIRSGCTILWNMCYDWNIRSGCEICEMYEIFRKNIAQNISWNITRDTAEYYNIFREILPKINDRKYSNFLFYISESVFHIFHVFHNRTECFNNSTCFTIFTMFHKVFHQIFSEILCEILHSGFTEMAALQKFRFAASYTPWVHPHCYCGQSKSILTDSLLIANEFVSISSNSNTAIAMHSLSIHLWWFSIIIIIKPECCWLMLSTGSSKLLQCTCHSPWVLHAKIKGNGFARAEWVLSWPDSHWNFGVEWYCSVHCLISLYAVLVVLMCF